MKAILLIDIPQAREEDLRKGELRTEYNLFNNKDLIEDVKVAILKPLPEKQLDWNDDDEYVLGYNNCIDEILGEEECN